MLVALFVLALSWGLVWRSGRPKQIPSIERWRTLRAEYARRYLR